MWYVKELLSKSAKYIKNYLFDIGVLFSILVLALVLIKLVGLEKNTEKREVNSHTDSLFSSSGVSKTYCFYRDQKATPEAPYAVQEHVQMMITGASVTGTKTGTQSGPDMTNGYQGTLVGEVKDDEIEVVFSYVIEGSAQKELEVYELRSDWLVKKRYTLYENGDVLVPNKTEDPTLIVYKPEVCS